MYTIEYAEGVVGDLAAVRPFDRNRLLDSIEQQLTFEPTTETRNKKILVGLTPPWEHEPPIWELRVGQYRVFYDVDVEEQHVVVRAVRRKDPDKTTEEIV